MKCCLLLINARPACVTIRLTKQVGGTEVDHLTTILSGVLSAPLVPLTSSYADSSCCSGERRPPPPSSSCALSSNVSSSYYKPSRLTVRMLFNGISDPFNMNVVVIGPWKWVSSDRSNTTLIFYSSFFVERYRLEFSPLHRLLHIVYCKF